MAVLNATELAAALTALPGWSGGVSGIGRTYQFKDFAAAMAFVNKAAALAEAAQHHPDIDIRYNAVTMALSSHDEGGVTKKDTDMAARLDSATT